MAALMLPVVLSAGVSMLTGQPDPLLLGAASPSPLAWQRHPLVWQRAEAWSQPWRWWGAAWVHLDTWHRGANLVGGLGVLVLGLAAGLPRRAGLAWLLAWPVGHALLALVPGLTAYAGLSGSLHAGVAVVVVHLLAPGRSSAERRVGLALAAGLTLKLGLEQTGVSLPGIEPGLAVAPAGHLVGTLAGLLSAAMVLVVPARR